MTTLACKTLHVSAPVGQFIVGESECGPSSGVSADFNQIEMTDLEYCHLQHIFQSHTEAQDESVETNTGNLNQRCFPNHSDNENDALCSPPTTPAMFQPSALSTLSTGDIYRFSGSDHAGPEEVQEMKLVLCSDTSGDYAEGEKTPAHCVEVPISVLAKVKYAKEASDQRAVPPLKLRPNPPARVCLEKRFNCSPHNKNRQQETQAAVLKTFISILQHSSDTQGIALLSQTEMKPRAEKRVVMEHAYPYGDRFLNTHVQGLSHRLEGSKHLEVISSQNVSYRSEKTTDKSKEQGHIRPENDEEDKSFPPLKSSRMRRPLEEQTPNIFQSLENSASSGCRPGKRTRLPLVLKQQRERHNRKERDRRRRIRLCCDELNLLVPFCNTDTDKATTLQWTTAFLKYIQEVHGDTLKQDFENTFCGKTGVRLKPNSAVLINCIDESTI
ncbi:transcription factor-like 5 protein isoform X2 [Hoplias malabaricus]|uniref:transcription factor-like 5 protein isoform X2 n=1 Tax=Hoplias malabaricus TaxID=27720 RepID=UPI003461A770